MTLADHLLRHEALERVAEARPAPAPVLEATPMPVYADEYDDFDTLEKAKNYPFASPFDDGDEERLSWTWDYTWD